MSTDVIVGADGADGTDVTDETDAFEDFFFTVFFFLPLLFFADPDEPSDVTESPRGLTVLIVARSAIVAFADISFIFRMLKVSCEWKALANSVGDIDSQSRAW